jgi:hypothetical protein
VREQPHVLARPNTYRQQATRNLRRTLQQVGERMPTVRENDRVPVRVAGGGTHKQITEWQDLGPGCQLLRVVHGSS